MQYLLLLFQNYQQTKQELKNLQNEKDHIPNVTSNEQYDFLSNYQYEEYK